MIGCLAKVWHWPAVWRKVENIFTLCARLKTAWKTRWRSVGKQRFWRQRIPSHASRCDRPNSKNVGTNRISCARNSIPSARCSKTWPWSIFSHSGGDRKTENRSKVFFSPFLFHDKIVLFRPGAAVLLLSITRPGTGSKYTHRPCVRGLINVPRKPPKALVLELLLTSLYWTCSAGFFWEKDHRPAQKQEEETESSFALIIEIYCVIYLWCVVRGTGIGFSEGRICGRLQKRDRNLLNRAETDRQAEKIWERYRPETKLAREAPSSTTTLFGDRGRDSVLWAPAYTFFKTQKSMRFELIDSATRGSFHTTHNINYLQNDEHT